MTSIGYETFSGCSSLVSITLPEGVTSIGSYAFYSCGKLTSITIPESVTIIEYIAFCFCSSLTSITCKAANPPTLVAIGVFYDVDKSIPLYVPKGSVEVYKSTEYWSEFTNIVGVDMETGIDNSEFTIQNSELIYDLIGRKVNAPQKDGIYIVGGKKLVIK